MTYVQNLNHVSVNALRLPVHATQERFVFLAELSKKAARCGMNMD